MKLKIATYYEDFSKPNTFAGLLSIHRFATVLQSNPIMNEFQSCYIGSVHFEREKTNKTAIPKMKKSEWVEVFEVTLQQKLHENTPLFLPRVDSHTTAFLGNVFCHSYAHCYIPLAVIATTFGLS